ncbi:hypothetical protein MIZ03_3943 [Rhodoferax lithotrophicus]|uniref:Uncharacterized protein n=1 Tax=Rhodoferax lithotrophicus TaxID=2798804 RepID=A0ABM7MRP7_9BURK|nr:hypothetical protein [Rhodoferax sp. MIZ03]BCO29032.1 hypothetical protein MIZ03_3943 [Rhodoferax sp. MIZ03]
MGFWSSVGSICSSVASSIGSAVSSVASAVGRGVSAAYNTAKDMAGRAVGWMAEKAGNFVDGVKKVWDTVKPYVAQIRTALKAAAAATAVTFPWLSGALVLLDNGLGALTAFENSPIAKKVQQAIDWSIKLAQRWQGNKKEEQKEHEYLNEEELEQAKKYQEDLRFAEREVVSPEQRHQLELASVFNDFEIASADLDKTIKSAPEDFEHYLRLRATQKLLAMAEQKFRTAKTVDDISADDIFLVRIASDLIKANPELSNNAALRLDRVLTEIHGKKLLPFVFEELIASWAKRAEVLDKQWAQDNKALSKETTLYKYLLGAKEIQSELSAEEMQQLAALEVGLPKQKEALTSLATRQRDMERYVGAAEGLLQVLEKTPEQIEAEDRAYLLEEGTHIGKLLIDCAQTDMPFSQLNKEDQSLLTDYANIFKNESKTRMKGLLEVTA